MIDVENKSGGLRVVLHDREGCEAYRLQLAAAQKEPLLAAPITTQTDWVDAAPRESGGQSLMF